MHVSTSYSSLICGGLLGAAAVGLFLAPDEFTAPIRHAVWDATVPGQSAVNMSTGALEKLREKWAVGGNRDQELAALRSEVDRWQLHCRRLQVENMMVSEKYNRARKEGVPPVDPSVGASLLQGDLLEASLLGDRTAAAWRSGRFVDRGSNTGIVETDLVLESTAPLVDQGREADLSPDQPVYSGRIVVGKIAEVGKWTSTIEHVTDASFRGHAQLVRRTEQGDEYAATGILEGRGNDLCRLNRIPATEAVDVGDDVYTADREGAFPYPMFYGKVIQAELKTSAQYWEILVKPAAADLRLQTVQIFRRQLNSQRLLAQ